MQRDESICRRAMVLTVLLTAIATAIACSGLRDRDLSEAPAPEFNHITDEQLQSAMWQLAEGIRSLQTIFGSQGPVRQSQHAEVVRILDEMIAAADELGPDGVATNHDRISHNLGRFREKLVIARRSAAMTPPRYFLVGNLSGTCQACHSTE